jgi:hypothetical protein
MQNWKRFTERTVSSQHRVVSSEESLKGEQESPPGDFSGAKREELFHSGQPDDRAVWDELALSLVA